MVLLLDEKVLAARSYQSFDTYPLPTVHVRGNFLPTAFGGNTTLNEYLSDLLNQFMQRDNDLYQRLKTQRMFREEMQYIRETRPTFATNALASTFVCGLNYQQQTEHLIQMLTSFIANNETIASHPEFYAGLQRNNRKVDKFPTETLAKKFAAGVAVGKYGHMADPAQYFRVTLAIDDDGGMCPKEFYTSKDDDDDEDMNPCNDDDDGLGTGSSATGTGGFAMKCCSPVRTAPASVDGTHACKGTGIVVFDDEEADWDDEETSNSRFPGNEVDDDDANNDGSMDDDDGKYTLTEINNIATSTLSSENLLKMLAGIEGKVNATHGQITGIINFANEIWTCANNVPMPVPLIIAADFNVTYYVGVFNMTTNMTDYIPVNMTVEVPVEVVLQVQLCTTNTTFTQTVTGMSNYTTQVLVMGMPMNVTIPFNITSTFIVMIPDESVLPQLEQLGGVVPEVVVLNSTHFSYNSTQINTAALPVFLNVSFVLIDPQPFGPFALVGRNNEPCVYCSRLCEAKSHYESIQVVRTRTDRELVHLMFQSHREVRVLHSHLTPKGDLLCELKDIVDWMNCFVRSMMFPQMERFLGCMELFYWGAQASAPFPEYTTLTHLLEYIELAIERIEFWYAEYGYYTQDTIDRGCINPAIIEHMQACFEYPNVTKPGKIGVCTSEDVSNPFASTAGDCALNGITNSKYGHARTCRGYSVNRVIRAMDEAVDIIERLSIGMLIRIDLISEKLRRAREENPADYVFPPADGPCFAQVNSTMADFVPTGDETLAGEWLFNTTGVYAWDIMATQPVVNV